MEYEICSPANGDKGNPINLISDSKFTFSSNTKDQITEFEIIPVDGLDNYTYLKEKVYFIQLMPA